MSNLGIFIALAFFTISIGMEVYATEYESGNFKLSVTTDKKFYDEEEKIIISGTADPNLVQERQRQYSSGLVETVKVPITIQIISVKDNIVAIAQLEAEQDGTFSHTVMAGGLWKDIGEYKVKAYHGEGNIAETQFFFKSDTPVFLEPKPKPEPTLEPEPEPEPEPVPQPELQPAPEPALETEEKVTICHIPGNNANPQTITVSVNELQSHLSRGDTFGKCGTKYISQSTSSVDTVDSSVSSQDDDLSELIGENKKLREELERQGEQIDELNQEVDWLKQIIQSIQGFFSSIFG